LNRTLKIDTGLVYREIKPVSVWGTCVLLLTGSSSYPAAVAQHESFQVALHSFRNPLPGSSLARREAKREEGQWRRGG
jgi:hypothetical protein